MKNIAVSSLRLDGGTQQREHLDEATIQDYADAMLSGTTFPPIVVYSDGVDNWLADGFHRVYAAQRAKVKELPADVRRGDQRSAILAAVGANTANGLRRTNEDKRKAVTTLLGDKEWAKWSDRKIAEACGVSHNFVGTLRPSLSSNDSEARTYTTKHGTTATMNTANIGKAKPAPSLGADDETLDESETVVVNKQTGEVMDAKDVEVVKTTTRKFAPAKSTIVSVWINTEDPDDAASVLINELDRDYLIALIKSLSAQIAGGKT